MATSIGEVRASIDALIPDNVNKAITAKKVRDALNIIVDANVPQFGLMSAPTISPAQNITTTYQKLTGFSNEAQAGDSIIPSNANSNFTVNKDGLYIITGRAAINFDNNKQLTLVVARNGIPIGFEIPMDGLGASKPVFITLPGGAISLLSGDTIELQAKFTAASGTLTVKSIFFQVQTVPFGILGFSPV